MPRTLAVVALLGLALPGCGPAKLDETKNYDIDPGETKFVILPAQPRPQRLTVEYDAASPVEVGIYKTDDVKDQPATLPSSKALAVDKAKAAGTISADLGPDVSTTVTVTGLGKKTAVKVRITNRK